METHYRTIFNDFTTLTRQNFRNVFQPSRIVIGVISDAKTNKANLITICFNMYCSYKPPMISFAVHKSAYSFDLLQMTEECVIAVPGEKLAKEALYCGTESGRQKDKVCECDIKLIDSQKVKTPGMAAAIANIELRIVNRILTGDHLTIFGEVLRFAVNKKNQERCLLSVGPRVAGYEVIARKGIHRIAVVDGD